MTETQNLTFQLNFFTMMRSEDSEYIHKLFKIVNKLMLNYLYLFQTNPVPSSRHVLHRVLGAKVTGQLVHLQKSWDTPQVTGKLVYAGCRGNSDN